MVCLSIAFRALSYNFSSGSGDALAYDSLKQFGLERQFEKDESNQMILYRLCSGISTLCAGFALTLGYRMAYGTGLMLCNSLVGAVDVLLLFFLQAKLPESGISKWWLGYRWIFMISMLLVMTGLLAEHSAFYQVMVIGGFVAAIGDDALQVRTNAELQNMFPSEQRATLISIESFSFSIIMIVLSPLAGFFFSYW